MDSGTSTIFGVATSDRARRLYNAVISTGREALDVVHAGRAVHLGWLPSNQNLIENLERLASDADVLGWMPVVGIARKIVRGFFDANLRPG